MKQVENLDFQLVGLQTIKKAVTDADRELRDTQSKHTQETFSQIRGKQHCHAFRVCVYYEISRLNCSVCRQTSSSIRQALWQKHVVHNPGDWAATCVICCRSRFNKLVTRRHIPKQNLYIIAFSRIPSASFVAPKKYTYEWINHYSAASARAIYSVRRATLLYCLAFCVFRNGKLPAPRILQCLYAGVRV